MAKIAAELKQAVKRRALEGAPGGTARHLLARGPGWSVADVLCTAGPQDRPFAEQHQNVCIAVVAAGSFQYHSSSGHALLAPGSLMLGAAGQPFECGHQHATGDRCIAFSFAPDYFEALAAGVRTGPRGFRVAHLPPVRALSPAIARACAGLARCSADPFVWEELGVQFAVEALRLTTGAAPRPQDGPLNGEARVTPVLRFMEECPDADCSLAQMAQVAKLSQYHFLRTFQHVTGLTPHQYLLRRRLRAAAVRLIEETPRSRVSVLDIAYDSGFGDVSNFNRSFRTEFGMSPRVFRRTIAGHSLPARAASH